MAEATLSHGSPLMVDYTPGSAVTAGQVVILGEMVCVCHTAIPADTLGALAVYGGVYEVTADAAISANKNVYWDNSTNKITETVGTNKRFGFTLEAASGDNAKVRVVHIPNNSPFGNLASQAAVVAALTDNSGGSANSTLAAIDNALTGVDGTGSNAAPLAGVNTQLGVIRDCIADLAAKQSAILTSLKNAKIMASA